MGLPDYEDTFPQPPREDLSWSWPATTAFIALLAFIAFIIWVFFG